MMVYFGGRGFRVPKQGSSELLPGSDKAPWFTMVDFGCRGFTVGAVGLRTVPIRPWELMGFRSSLARTGMF